MLTLFRQQPTEQEKKIEAQRLIVNNAKKYASYIYNKTNLPQQWQIAFEYFCLIEVQETRDKCLELAETFDYIGQENIVIKRWFQNIHAQKFRSPESEDFKKHLDRQKSLELDMELELKNIKIVRDVLSKVDSYLKGKSGQKLSNATKARDSLLTLLKSVILSPTVCTEVSDILNTWENDDVELNNSYTVGEFGNLLGGNNTKKTIKQCRDSLEKHIPGCTKKDDNYSSSNSNTPTTMLHTYTSTSTKVEDQLFSLLYNEEFDKFKQLIEQNLQGYKIDATNKNGETLLHHAAVAIDFKFLTLLLELGANPNIEDSKGRTPVYWAVYRAKLPDVLLFINNTKVSVDWEKQTKTGLLEFAKLGKTHHDKNEKGHSIACKHKEVIEAVEQAVSKTTKQMTSTL